jgi:hypothetical protein
MIVPIPDELKSAPHPNNADIVAMRELQAKGYDTARIMAVIYGGTQRAANFELVDFLLDNNILTEVAIEESFIEPEPEPEPEPEEPEEDP